MVIKIDFVDGGSEAIEIDKDIKYFDCFRYNGNTNCFEIRNKLETDFNCSLKELSMGMSQDYKIAVKHGATMLRIGRKLFI